MSKERTITQATRKIVALVDGSAYAASVCDHAAWIAQRTRLISHRGRAILEDARASLDRHSVPDATTRLRHGDLVEAVAEVETDARVIIIGKRGEAADLAKGHLESHLERIVRASHKPGQAGACTLPRGLAACRRRHPARGRARGYWPMMQTRPLTPARPRREQA